MLGKLERGGKKKKIPTRMTSLSDYEAMKEAQRLSKIAVFAKRCYA